MPSPSFQYARLLGGLPLRCVRSLAFVTSAVTGARESCSLDGESTLGEWCVLPWLWLRASDAGRRTEEIEWLGKKRCFDEVVGNAWLVRVRPTFRAEQRRMSFIVEAPAMIEATGIFKLGPKPWAPSAFSRGSPMVGEHMKARAQWRRLEGRRAVGRIEGVRRLQSQPSAQSVPLGLRMRCAQKCIV